MSVPQTVPPTAPAIAPRAAPAGQAGRGPLIVFSHANSFPASTYGVLHQQLHQRGFTVAAIEKLGHDPAHPVTSNWPHLLTQLATFAENECRHAGQGAFLVGHSLGGFLSLLCAAQHPRLGGFPVRGVLLLDSPVIAGWRAALLGLAKGTGLVSRLSPGAVSSKRRNAWSSADEALAHFQSKAAFAAWDPETLRHYIEHGTVRTAGDPSAARRLAFDRDVETAIYNTLPHHAMRVLRRTPPPCPVAFIGGKQSAEVRQVGLAATRAVTKGRITMIEGTHLFPMEHPRRTAETIARELQAMIEGAT
jgi:pimeloyl-ACP methyl ester carboxylesterase